MSGTSQAAGEHHCFLCGVCPDEHCQTKLYFPSYDVSVECTNCGQRHPRDALRSIAEVTDPDVALHNMVRNLLMGNFAPKKTTDSVKVLGLSNYHCKLLSPLLTHYGMDKQGNPQPLCHLNQGDIFDCAKTLGSRAFLIQPEHIDIMGYGRDQTGSARYLHNTLQQIKLVNDDQEVLIPIHADGDGHCLVHGISRALVGRELFWHALRTNLRKHFEEHLGQYQALFCDFVDKDEWPHIIAESDPDYLPGPNEAMGLQNIHIFGLANVLRRPIILLDSLSGLQSFGDYSGVFLPVLYRPEDCRGKDGKQNKPLCVAWSSSGRNHFIALVGVKGRPLPRLPRWMLSKAWGAPQEKIDSYIDFDEHGMCTVGGDRTLPEGYVQRLATAMEGLFLTKHKVHPALVSDVYNYIYKKTGIVGIHHDIIIQRTRECVLDHQLYRCLICNAVSQVPTPPGYAHPQGLQAGGRLYKIAQQTHGALQEGRVYEFPAEDVQCSYDASRDELVPDLTSKQAVVCPWCQGKQLRRVEADGRIMYVNGDRTSAASNSTTCNCGHKHFWDGQEYDNPPNIFKVPLVWKGQTIEEDVVWFERDSDPALNSNAFKIAESLVNKHFSGEFGTEQLVQKVVESILQNTASKEPSFQPPSLTDMPSTSQSGSGSSPHHGGASPRQKAGPSDDMESAHTVEAGSPRRTPGAKSKEGSPSRTSTGLALHPPSKIILTGSSKSLHKEELTLSVAEKSLRKRISENAPLHQQKLVEERTQMMQTNKPEVPASNMSEAKGQEVKSVTMDTGSTSQTIEPPRDIRIKLSSSEGKNATLVLDASTTYSQLQTLIESKLHVTPSRQRIKYGFPPKELRAPPSGEEGTALPLRNGDKLMVDVLPDPNRADPHHSHHVTAGIAANRQKRIGSSEPGLGQGALLKEFQKGIDRITNSKDSNLEVQLNSLTLLAALSGLDLWHYSKGKPELFERGGLFYNIVERDLGLEDGKHCMLPSIPEKRFRFSGPNDRLELCLEPLGHFPVGPDVDDLERLKDVALGQKLGQRSLEMGESDIVAEEDRPSSSGYIAFAGRGHSLSVNGGTSGSGQGDESEGSVQQNKYHKFGEGQMFEEMKGGEGNGKQGAIQETEIGRTSEVQYAESHIPGELGQPRVEMEQDGVRQGLCVELEHSKFDMEDQRGVGDVMDGGSVVMGIASEQVDQRITPGGGGSMQRDTPMDVDRENERGESLIEQTLPLPMEVDSTKQDEQLFSFSQSQAASSMGIVAELRRLNTEPVIGQIPTGAVISRAASDSSLLLPAVIATNIEQSIQDTSLQGAANRECSSSSDSQCKHDSNESGSVISSDDKRDTESGNQEAAYVPRRLGPGYTVLVKKQDEL